MGYHSEDAFLVHKLLDDNRNGFITLFNFYKFFGETLPGYRHRKRLADSLYDTILPKGAMDLDPDGNKGISRERFCRAMVENHRMWSIFQTCLPFKLADQ